MGFSGRVFSGLSRLFRRGDDVIDIVKKTPGKIWDPALQSYRTVPQVTKAVETVSKTVSVASGSIKATLAKGLAVFTGGAAAGYYAHAKNIAAVIPKTVADTLGVPEWFASCLLVGGVCLLFWGVYNRIRGRP